MSFINKAVKTMDKVSDGLKENKNDKSSFLWSFIENQLREQPLENLLDFRKLLNKIINDKFKEDRDNNKGDVIA